MTVLSNTDLIQVLQAMIAVEKKRGGAIGRAIVVSNLQGIMGDVAFLDDVRSELSRSTTETKEQ